jgi:hypothetical protein
MNNKVTVIEAIRAAFGDNPYLGDNFLQGSFEGCEPAEVIAPFKSRTDWQNLDPALLDAHYDALSFFSEAGLRFFLPAYLIADLNDELNTADPLFVLTHGFSDVTIEHPTKTRVFVRKIGQTALLNPRRYGAMTFYDYARFRLSVFTREEAQAIVVYLQYKRDSDPYRLHFDVIETALNLYWLERAAEAPTTESLRQHLKEEAEYMAAISSAPEDGK